VHRGDTLLMPITRKPKEAHLWILVTEPTTDGTCVTVNITTPTSRRADRTIILQKGDHPFIQHESIITYADAQFETVKDLQNYVSGGTAKPKQAISPRLLRRIQDGLINSPETPYKIRDFCKALWGIP